MIGNDDGDSTAASAAVNYVRSVLNATYDGVVGQVPEWFRPPLPRDAFYESQCRLLYDHDRTLDEIHGWMRACSSLADFAFGDAVAPPWPLEYDQEIRTLMLVKALVDAGPKLALKLFLGDEQYKKIGAQFRQEQLNPHIKANAIPTEQRELVREVFAKKHTQNPKKYGAYQETADEIGITVGRVRYILEGRR